jgi:CBS domain-containing protein
MLRSVNLTDYMQRQPFKVRANDRLFDAIEVITRNRISGAVVVDAEDRLVGMLSEMDCLRAILAATYHESADVGLVREHMTAAVISCRVNDNIVDVAVDMLSKGHRRRPVIADDGALVGVITCRKLLDVIRSFNEPDRRR